MKRFLSILFVFSLLLMLVSGCNQPVAPEPLPEPTPEAQPTTQPEPSPEPTPEVISLSIVSTIFPQYDWVRQILGDKADNMDLTLVINNRIDLHNFQPSVSDIVNISTSDLFIYVGGESDGWVEDALKQSVNPNMVVINLLELLGDSVKFEEIIEGMDHDHCDDDDCDDETHDHSHSHDSCSADSHDDCDDDTHDHDHDHSDHDDHDDHVHHHGEIDEHVWLSLRNAVIFCNAITDALSTLDPDNAEVYRANMIAYLEILAALDTEYRTVVDAASVATLLFADRFPFRYLVDDYGLRYYAAFPGCSAETEASFSTIIFLAGKVDELELRNVMVTESADDSIARTIISNTETGNQQILVLDSMQSANSTDWQNGITFLSIMESNLDVLRQALS